MRTNFTKLLTSAWATKSEYFVLVGFLFGVVIAYLFSVPDVWAFTIGLAQIVGGFGAILAVGVAVWQINELRSHAIDDQKRLERNAAVRVFYALSSSGPAFRVMADNLMKVLSDTEVQWMFNGGIVKVVLSPTNPVAEKLVNTLTIVPKLELTEDVVLLSSLSLELLSWERILQGATRTIEEKMAIMRKNQKRIDVDLLGNMPGSIQTILQCGMQMATWLLDEFPVISEKDKIFQRSSEHWSELAWPNSEHLVELAMKNPPTDWGDRHEDAEKAWRDAGKTGNLPVNTR